MNITSYPLGGVLFQSGYGIPNHLSTKGSIYVDLYTAIQYINKDGFNTWLPYYDSNDLFNNFLALSGVPVELLDDVTKYIILTRLNDCIYFERYSDNLILIANMMGITNEQLDEIFINGNLLD